LVRDRLNTLVDISSILRKQTPLGRRFIVIVKKLIFFVGLINRLSRRIIRRRTFDHRIIDAAQIGKLARGIKRNFRKVEWLNKVPHEELQDCIFKTRE